LAQYGGHAPWMITDFALCFDARIASELRDLGATVHLLGPARVRSPRSVAAARRALSRVLDSGGYDVVVCHSAWPHALFARVARQHGARLVQFMHDIPNRMGWIDHLASSTPPDVVLCNTRFMESSGRWWFPNVPRRMTRYPVPIGHRIDPTSRATVRASFGTSTSAVVILQASRMQAWKGHQRLIEALHHLRNNPRWACWIAGGPQRPREVAYERELRAMVERLGLADRVTFLGQRSDVPAIMQAADIYCQPNAAPEPFGVVFLEALAAGLPVVTTAMGGPLEIVDERCGSLVQPGVQPLSAALARLIDDDAKRSALSREAPARARELCDLETRVRELADALAGPKKSNPPLGTRARAAFSEGHSSEAVLSTVARALREKADGYESIVDLGCGRGDCARWVNGLCQAYLGGDLVQYEHFPRSRAIRFREVDLNKTPYPFEDQSASAVVSVETIEHVENPRALVREMARIVRPGGWVVVTTPNQLSLTSKLYLVTRNQFHAFQEAPGLYPAHITALVEADLRRIARECGLVDVDIRYTDQGRVPLTSLSWPRRLGARGRWFSDNVVMVARRP
jgi:glycosyltransferase involved in cell wall biosynthesis/2-polyprenyl-3-methyl-5-hydroxy-6-metoxy-1,4-benzoquinol methylase